ncbi:MAG: beta-galactosidase trimerization domain-containing protein [Bacilli bacterium]|nr:beta-galactosidase trimerization domain-containing protein [Bacilli bacterium]
MKWYKGIYRRNLVDMHINDTDEEYLSKFSATDYFNYLKEAHIKSPMIYLQSHIGLCYFPTKVSKTHAFFIKHPDEIQKLIKLCHEDDMKVVGYYSLIFNNQAFLDHPDWRMIDKDKKNFVELGQRYGLVCPNNPDYKAFLKTQLEELYAHYPDLDGIFYDMPYWEMMCHCEHCQKDWAKISDKPMPTKVNWLDPEWKKYVSMRQKEMGDFVKYVRELSESILKGVTVEFNFAAAVACDWLAGSTELINEECEFTGGDLYGDLYNHSFTAKYYYGITKNQPFEYMTCRCNHNLREHTVTKSENALESEIMLSTMHHGASLIIDAINPDGSLDHRVSKRLGKVFEKQMPYEPYMDKGELEANVGVYFDTTSNFRIDDVASNRECAIQATRTLIENHVPVTVLANKHLNNLNRYQVIVAPQLGSTKNDEINKLIEYVNNGGTLYLSGRSDELLLKTFFDGYIEGTTYGDSSFKHVYKGYDEVQCYINPITEEYKKAFNEFDEKYPLPITYKLPIIKFSKGEVKANIVLPYTDPDNNLEFASIHSNPPGRKSDIPAIVEVNYGKGKVIYCSAHIESDTRYNFKEVFMNMLKPYIKTTFEVKASKYVESILFKDNNDYYLNLYDLNFIEDIVERKFEIKLPKGHYEVYELPNMNKVDIDNGYIKGKFEKYYSLYIKELN